jgi:hypothetical protein
MLNVDDAIVVVVPLTVRLPVIVKFCEIVPPVRGRYVDDAEALVRYVLDAVADVRYVDDADALVR